MSHVSKLPALPFILKPSQICCLTTSPCRQGCVGRQSIMVKRKFEQELSAQVSGSFLPHLDPEENLAKKHKLPLPPKIGPRPLMKMKLSWNGAPEIVVRVMLDCGANVPVISQETVERHQIPGVLRKQACGMPTFDGNESNNAGREYTLAFTRRKRGHYTL